MVREECIAACPSDVREFKVCLASCIKRCKKKVSYGIQAYLEDCRAACPRPAPLSEAREFKVCMATCLRRYGEE